MKKGIALLFFILLLTGCGNTKNKLDLDLEKVKDLVIDKALEQKVIQEGDYKREDIQPIKVCEAIEFGSKEFEGDYIIFWETSDDLYKRDFTMKDYELDYEVRYEEVQNRCIDF